MAHCFKEELYWFRIEWGTCWSVCFRGATLKSVYTWRSTHNNNLRSAPRDGGGCSCCLPSSHVVHTHSGGQHGGPSKAHSSMCPIQCETNKVVLWCNVPWINLHIPKSLGQIKTFGTLYPSDPPNIWLLVPYPAYNCFSGSHHTKKVNHKKWERASSSVCKSFQHRVEWVRVQKNKNEQWKYCSMWNTLWVNETKF